MEQNSFDQNIKNKLKNRTIKPSDNAWNLLSDKLEAQENKKSYKAYWWLGIAASIVGILFFTIKGFDTNPAENNMPIIVDSHVEEKVDNQDIIKVETLEIVNPVIDDKMQLNALESQPIAEVKKESINQSETNKILIVKSATNINKSLVEVDENSISTSNEVKTVEPSTVSFEEQKIQEVIAQIMGLENDNETVTDAEIEQLLEHAEKQIKLKRLYDESTSTVDANSLLQSVEDDLEQSFREKVLKALQSNYETIRVAVSERND